MERTCKSISHQAFVFPMYVRSSPVLRGLAGDQISIAEHGPNWWKRLFFFWEIFNGKWLPILVVHMAINFFDHSLNKLSTVLLVYSLMEIYRIYIHLWKESNGTPHSILKVHIYVMLCLKLGLKGMDIVNIGSCSMPPSGTNVRYIGDRCNCRCRYRICWSFYCWGRNLV